METIWKGTIWAYEADQTYLEKLGIKLGAHIAEEGAFVDCELSQDALDKLDPHWGTFCWSLTPYEQETQGKI